MSVLLLGALGVRSTAAFAVAARLAPRRLRSLTASATRLSAHTEADPHIRYATQAHHPPFFTSAELVKEAPGSADDALADPDSAFLLVDGPSGVIGTAGEAPLVVQGGTAAAAALARPTAYLGSVGATKYWVVQHADPNPGSQLRDIASGLEPTLATLACRARAMARWHSESAFCGKCGSATSADALGTSRKCTCGQRMFPRIDPAVIALVVAEDADGVPHALLGRQASWPPNRYSCLAGFIDYAESAEQAVAREVLEESGVAVDVGSVAYRMSQPWPDRFKAQSLMLGYRCTVASTGGGGLPASKAVDGELDGVTWVTRPELLVALDTEPGADGLSIPSGASVARRLLSEWALEE